MRAATTQRMEEAEDTLRAIGAGEVDAFVVSGNGGGSGDQVFTLVDADRPYRLFVENMPDGAATVSAAGLILYANRRLCRTARVAARDDRGIVAGLARGGRRAAGPAARRRPAASTPTVELEVVDSAGLVVPVLVGASPLRGRGRPPHVPHVHRSQRPEGA